MSDLVSDADELQGSLLADVRTFLKRTFRWWVWAATSSPLVAIAGSYVGTSQPPPNIISSVSWFVFVAGLAAGAFKAWRTEYRRRLQLEGLPQLRMVFVEGKEPYEQDHAMPNAEGHFAHYYRVGVIHDGIGRVEDVSVVLAELEPLPTGFPLMHRLVPMGEPKGTSSSSISAGTQPTRFFDLIVQTRQPSIARVAPGDDPATRFRLKARGNLHVRLVSGHPPGIGRLRSIRLVAEGRNAKLAELHLVATTSRGPGCLLELRHSGRDPRPSWCAPDLDE